MDDITKLIRDMNDILKVLREIDQNTLLASKQMLTTEDVSKLTGISKTQLRNYRGQRAIPYYKKTAKLVYYDKNEIIAWMRQNRMMTIDEAAGHQPRLVGDIIRDLTNDPNTPFLGMAKNTEG